jgi:hypothetical protein
MKLLLLALVALLGFAAARDIQIKVNHLPTCVQKSVTHRRAGAANA